MKNSGPKLAALIVASIAAFNAARAQDIEVAVCGRFLEPLAFSFWTAAAERHRDPIEQSPHVERIGVPMRDGTRIEGFRLNARAARPANNPVLLVVQGNAMLAQNLLAELRFFAEKGLDVYVFDFRGYGLSPGKPRFKAIVDDYKEIIRFVTSNGSVPLLQYGLSFGGIVLLAANVDGPTPRRFVIDSTPSTVSNQGCPQAYDPINTLSSKAGSVALIVGGEDRIVSPKASQALADLVKARSGSVLYRDNWVHPFMESSPEALKTRLEAVHGLLTHGVN